MRKLVALAAVAAAGWIVARRAQEAREEADLWAEVTDPAPAPAVRPAG